MPCEVIAPWVKPEGVTGSLVSMEESLIRNYANLPEVPVGDNIPR